MPIALFAEEAAVAAASNNAETAMYIAGFSTLVSIATLIVNFFDKRDARANDRKVVELELGHRRCQEDSATQKQTIAKLEVKVTELEKRDEQDYRKLNSKIAAVGAAVKKQGDSDSGTTPRPPLPDDTGEWTPLPPG